MLKVKNVTIGEGQPKICLPITGQSVTEIERQVIQIKEKKPDLVEWRVDFYPSHDIELPLQIIHQHIRNIPLIFTYRTKQEGGQREITDQDYLAINEKAMMSNLIDFVDLELKQPVVIRDPLIAKAKQQGVHTIISNHDFEKTPANEELINRLKEAELIGASVAKIAVTPTNTQDVLRLLSVTNKMKDMINIPLITMSMGGVGLVTRLMGEVFGSAVTFGAAGQASAPGQIDSETLSTILNVIHQNFTK
ncbi:type I 3-dehydroquinate dehydratase [Amphibacillus sp. Q70]|uniref:type I 3-dehydroquinate dehydratase n=1 Tax=Amphibacillus sp. Q70 TaxID=3453416 RepID=UPI003F869ACA